MSFMKPVVVHTLALVVETRCDGTVIVPVDSPDEKPAMFAADDVLSFEVRRGFAARLSAPGYMDATDWSLHDTEAEAWASLVEEYPEAFTFVVELTADDDAGTAHIYAPSDEAADAIRDALGSVCGQTIEQDGDFLYVSLAGLDEDERDAIRDEIEAAGFDTIEG